MEYVIIGCGPAGLHAAKTISSEDSDADITLVSWELSPFYIRPALVDFISGKVSKEAFFYKPADILDGSKARFELGRRVVSIVPDKNRILFSDGGELRYKFLLIATGARPQVEPLWLAHREKLQTLRSLAGAVRLKRSLKDAKHVAVIGGGYQALEIVRACHAMGIEVSYLSPPDTFWPDEVAGVKPKEVEKKLKSVGIDLWLDARVADIIDRDGTGYRIIAGDGMSVDADTIILSPKHNPNIDFLEDSGLQLHRGVIVSEELRTSAPNIYAAGDVAQVYDPNSKINRLNFGWLSAREQGVVAGSNMVGRNLIFVRDEEAFFTQLMGKNPLDRW
ncbi:NAD(P)/FAD-dependent oxidoreductase [candidate division KSB1 bacterium]